MMELLRCCHKQTKLPVPDDEEEEEEEDCGSSTEQKEWSCSLCVVRGQGNHDTVLRETDTKKEENM